MNDSIQYTVRDIPPAIDAQLKAQAKKQGISLNKLLLKKIGALPPQKSKKPKVYHDLDWFFGSMSKEGADELDAIIMEERQAARKRAQEEYEAEKARGEWD